MGINGLPQTYDGYLELLTDYEREQFAFDPANKRVTEATIRIGRATAPWYLRLGFRRVTIALMDEPLRVALGMEEQPRWLVACRRPRAAAAREGAAVPRRPAARRTNARTRRTRTATSSTQIGPSDDARRAEQDLEQLDQGVARCLSARPSTSRSTRTSAPRRAPSWRRRSGPFHDQWEQDGQVDREVWRKAGEAGLLCFDVDEEYGGAGREGLPLQHRARRGDHPRRRQRRRLPGAQRRDRPLHQRAGERRAEAALAARAGLRRADLGDRDDRARRRLGPPGHPHLGRRQGRPLRRQRLEDVHHQRHPVRPGHRGRAHRPRRRAPGHQPARRRARHGRASSAAATSTRSGSRPRTPPSCSSTTSRSPRRTCSATRAPASSR